MIDAFCFILVMSNVLLNVYWMMICVLLCIEFSSKLIVWFLPVIFTLMSVGFGTFSIWVYKMVIIQGVFA